MLVIEKKVNNVPQTISVAVIIEYDMETIWGFETFIEEQAPCNKFTKISKHAWWTPLAHGLSGFFVLPYI